MAINISLIGNPNSGKTTMFNELTGSKAYVGNWPGVTVEKKQAILKNHKDVNLLDLPGIYSLSPYTLEEIVTRNHLLEDTPQAIINIIDGSNIERNLYLTMQLLELNIPTVIAINMIDIVNKRGDNIDIKKLSSLIGCPVVETSAIKLNGLKEVSDIAIGLAKNKKANTIRYCEFSQLTEESLSQIKFILSNYIDDVYLNWYAIKVFEKDEKALDTIKLSESDKQKIDYIIKKCEETYDDESDAIIIDERYDYIVELVKKCVTKKEVVMSISYKIDNVLTNRFLALPIFAVIMFLVYYISVTSLGDMVTVWANDTFFGGYVTDFTTSFLENIGASDVIISLVVDGIIGGVGAILGFVPQLMILFFLLCLLEDCGYMARIAFIMDKLFRKIGLSGKSFIPLLVSSGCGVPGVMASRTIENEKDRKLTIMVTTFMPCGAKLPIIALIAGALFSGNPFIAPSIYFLGIGAVVVSSLILKKSTAFENEEAPFIMELPEYHLPTLKNIWLHVWDRSKSFVIKAGTVIFIGSTIIWFTSNFNFLLKMVDTNESILAIVGGFISPIFSPLGFGNWQATVATFTGLVAKENVVSTLGILYGVGEVTEDNLGLLYNITSHFTSVSGYAFLVFNMLCAPCFAAIGAIRRELASFKWTAFAIAYQTLFAYSISFIIYQIGRVLFEGGSFGLSTILGLTVLVILIICVVYRPKRKEFYD